MSLQVFLFRVRSKKYEYRFYYELYTHLGLEDTEDELKPIAPRLQEKR